MFHPMIRFAVSRSVASILITAAVLAGASRTGAAQSVALADGEIAVAGTVSGSYQDTWADDGVVETIQERESGGKPANRHSFLEHRWTFTVMAGTSVSLQIRAWHTANSEGDDFELAWSTDDASYTSVGILADTSASAAPLTFPLPSSLSGTVFLRVQDLDRSKGNNQLDTLSVDQIFITSELGAPPAAPSGLVAEGISAVSIDLFWSDESLDESGFEIERSPDGASWSFLDLANADATSYADLGVSPATTRFYRVRAFNAGGSSGWSNTASATTRAAPGYVSEVVDSGSLWRNSLDFDAAGDPAIAYHLDGSVRFAHWNGTSWDVETVSQIQVTRGIDLVYCNALPAVSYCSGGGIGDKIYLAERVGSSWTIELVESGAGSEDIASGCDPWGRLILTYRKSKGPSKGVRVATRDNGVWLLETVDTVGTEYAYWRALAFDPAGNPAVAYQAEIPGPVRNTLKFAVRTGSAWNVEIVETGVDGYGGDPSLAYDPVTGLPGVVHSYKYGFGGPRFLRRDGSPWQLVADFAERGGKNGTLAYDVIGTPYVAYSRAVGFGSNHTWELLVARWDGLAWQKELVDFTPSEGVSFRLDPAGLPTLAYGASGDLVFAHAATP